MALAVHAAQTGERRLLMLFLVATMVLGAAFLGIKGVEYYHKFVEHHVPGPGFQFEAEHFRHAQIFFSLYFVMTGLHALHMIIGLGIMAVMLWLVVARHDHAPSTTARSRSAASTGTSSTSSGFSCSRCSTCWATRMRDRGHVAEGFSERHRCPNTLFPRASTTRSSRS